MAQHAHSLATGIRRLGIGQSLMFLPRPIDRWTEVRHERRQLDRLGHQLRDVWISLDEARRKAQSPFWDTPTHWLR